MQDKGEREGGGSVKDSVWLKSLMGRRFDLEKVSSVRANKHKGSKKSLKGAGETYLERVSSVPTKEWAALEVRVRVKVTLEFRLEGPNHQGAQIR